MKKLLLATLFILVLQTPAQAMNSDSASDTCSEDSGDSLGSISQERLEELIASNKEANPGLALHLEELRDRYFAQPNDEPPYQEQIYALTDLIEKKSPFYISALHKQGRIIMPSVEVVERLLRKACQRDNHDLVEFLMLEAGGNNTQYAQELVQHRLSIKDFVNAKILVDTYKIPAELSSSFLAYFEKKMMPRDERSRKSRLIEAYDFVKSVNYIVDRKTAELYYVLAVKYNHEKMVDYLLECGASKESTDKDSGNNALHALIQSGYPSRTLLQTIFEPTLLFQENRQGKLPMDYYHPHPEDDKPFTKLLVTMVYGTLARYRYHLGKNIPEPSQNQMIDIIKKRLTSGRFKGTLEPLSDSLNKKIAIVTGSIHNTHDN